MRLFSTASFEVELLEVDVRAGDGPEVDEQEDGLRIQGLSAGVDIPEFSIIGVCISEGGFARFHLFTTRFANSFFFPVVSAWNLRSVKYLEH